MMCCKDLVHLINHKWGVSYVKSHLPGLSLLNPHFILYRLLFFFMIFKDNGDGTFSNRAQGPVNNPLEGN